MTVKYNNGITLDQMNFPLHGKPKESTNLFYIESEQSPIALYIQCWMGIPFGFNQE